MRKQSVVNLHTHRRMRNVVLSEQPALFLAPGSRDVKDNLYTEHWLQFNAISGGLECIFPMQWLHLGYLFGSTPSPSLSLAGSVTCWDTD